MKTHMMKVFCGLIAVWFLLTSSSYAATYYVGACHASSYPTISAAVAVAPPGSTVKVCPGIYPEQVFITQALTLEGISSGNADRARITVPIPASGGPPTWQFVPDPDTPGVLVAPQIYVNSPAGVVTIENLTIDASGETTAPACLATGFWFTTAIFLENSSGTIKGVNTVGQGKNSGCGYGIRDFVAGASPATLSLTNSSLQDATWIGLELEGAGLTVSVKGNVLELTNGAGFATGDFGIESVNASGTISSNFVNGLTSGLVGDTGTAGTITYSDNVLRGATGCQEGMVFAEARAMQVTGNKIDGCLWGIDSGAFAPGVAVSIKNNLIVNSGNYGIELYCNSGVTLSGNTINNAPVGVNNAPSPLSTGQVTFDNVDTVATGTCP